MGTECFFFGHVLKSAMCMRLWEESPTMQGSPPTRTDAPSSPQKGRVWWLLPPRQDGQPVVKLLLFLTRAEEEQCVWP